MKENKRSGLVSSKISIIVIMIATLMITSTIATSAHAAPTLRIQGGGTGTFICGDGAVHTSSILQSFDARLSKTKSQSQKVTGEWSVFNREVNNGDGGTVSGIFYGGKMGKTSFNLLGIFNHPEGLCDNDSIPTKGTDNRTMWSGSKNRFSVRKWSSWHLYRQYELLLTRSIFIAS